MNTYILGLIREEAESIKKRMFGVKIYGVNIDKYTDSINVLVVAAYYMGRADEAKDKMFSITGVINV